MRGLFTPDRVLRSMLAHLHAREDRSVSACDQGPLRVQVVGWFRGGSRVHRARGSRWEPPLPSPGRLAPSPPLGAGGTAWPAWSRAPQEHRPERRLEHRPQTVWSMLCPVCSRALPPREPGRARESPGEQHSTHGTPEATRRALRGCAFSPTGRPDRGRSAEPGPGRVRPPRACTRRGVGNAS